jgi:protein-L-isoaspartate(D-aspartate) O-methyltransferase
LQIPEKLLNQLSIGGRLVIPVGDDSGQVMTTVDRISEVEFKKHEHETFRFVPMLEDKVK